MCNFLGQMLGCRIFCRNSIGYFISYLAYFISYLAISRMVFNYIKTLQNETLQVPIESMGSALNSGLISSIIK